MMNFSQRMGITPVRNAIQIDEIDEVLENKIWNCFLGEFFFKLDDHRINGNQSNRGIICLTIWEGFFVHRIDEIEIDGNGYIFSPKVLNYIKKWFFEKAIWNEIYNFIEFVAKLELSIGKKEFVKSCNLSLESEMSAYRIIDGLVAPIISEIEIDSIEEAISSSGLSSVETHLKSALSCFADRQHPDYRNSVKESISAVEAICAKIAGDDKLTLGKALKKLHDANPIHESYKQGFEKLYGFASNAKGIRHALLEDDTAITFEDAKFMLVSCSAFINFLKTKL